MATGSKRTKVTALVVDKSNGRLLRIMEDTLKITLVPYVEKFTKDRNWYSPLIALVGIATGLLKFDYKGIIIVNNNIYEGIDYGLLICLIVYVVLGFTSLFLTIRALYYINKYRHDDLSATGVVDCIMSIPSIDEDTPCEDKEPKVINY